MYLKENAEDVVVGEGNAMGPGETLLERVQRTGADVAVDDPKSGERERGKRPSPGRRAAWRGAVAHCDSEPGGAARRRQSSKATMKISVMMTAEPTHQRQMALMTNSSR